MTKLTPRRKPSPKGGPPGGQNLLEVFKDALSSPEADSLAMVTRKKDWAISVAKGLNQLVETDLASSKQQAALGEIYYKILHLPNGEPRPTEQQRKIVTAMADAMGIDSPTYEQSGVGRPTTGRKELAQVLYAGHPEMLLREGNDTPAGQRISQCIMVYKYEVGLLTPPRSVNQPIQGKPRVSRTAMKRVFMELWGVADAEQKEQLIILFRRREISGKEIDKWSAKANNDVIDVKAEEKATG